MRFNPRLREGGDIPDKKIPETLEVSIHASAKEATRSIVISGRNRISFNPRLREGGDRSVLSGSHPCCCFNPRLREGGDVIDNGRKV